MPRYILIDSSTGYVFGDTADYAAGRDLESIEDAARVLDESIGEHERIYIVRGSNPGPTATGYEVYRADIDGIEAVPVVADGQDAETILSVQDLCEYVGFVECVTSTFVD